ncbi:MAG: FKBP-type peptidyl-prolyl cis-trans isomerase [Bacteroidales bacterium]|nr:FKBP-type peptidyl-prolyl cis-trans isomerase [Bacteroidales bacterium]MBQ1904904.1 FKBP-type peptidyl-prolyl cis-trans isomerase [Bacteroidales bacterium]MBQ2104742.1 FKBP-type peptidyl-prolyl cis-trans isomerase [Bacteroidales bacterium]MBQ2501568.1 FKBP-type peptidyl-prolyl cis-trans isomerase [Bacteroidales bacterium]MBQ3976334.1 FKBP-type peptidyl-prolyl cis-trans isomerase [Bacteroidales bacterium]
MKRIPALIAAVLLAVCCGKDDAGYPSQVANINKYIDSQLESNPEYTVERDGDIARLTVVQGEGTPVKADGLVKIFYAGYVFSGGVSSSNLFATNQQDIAKSAGWVLTGVDYESGTVLDLSDKSLVEGLRKGLKGVKPGEECYILFPARYGNGNKIAGTIPAGSPLIYRIWVIDIENE